MRVLLIHDTRSMGFLTGVVYTRLRERLGDTVVPFFGQHTLDTEAFWMTTCGALPLEGIDEVVLCCMTFDRRNPERCHQRLSEIEARTARAPVILSHRWPDGYASTKYEKEILFPPYDLVEHHAKTLLPEERELLRLSTIVSRQAAPDLISPEDLALADQLAAALGEGPQCSDKPEGLRVWDLLRTDLPNALRELRATRKVASDTSLNLGTLDEKSEAFALFLLDAAARHRAEKTLEALMRDCGLPPEALGLGILRADGKVYAYIVRSWAARALPSVEWLLGEFAEQYQLGSPAHWVGPQDAPHLLFARAGLSESDLPSFKANLVRFARTAYATRSGARRPVGGLLRLVDAAASSALRSLDLLGRYTKGPAPALRFVPANAQVRVEPSHRTGTRRSTLILHLQIETPQAAAFLFGSGGYNFLKLERLLEGVLIGIASDRSRWLDAFQVPERLRVDTHFAEAAVEQLSSALGSSEVTTASLEQAIEAGFLNAGSTIATVLAEPPAGEPGKMIVFHESETIGPSVPYALVVGALAERLGMEKGDKLDVLDLFSGSGLSARAVLAKQPNWRVCCVDLSISSKQAGLADMSSVVWLKTDVRQVLSGEKGILDRKFDLVCMDPPHGALLEILFAQDADGPAVIQRLSSVSGWLVVYQGHVSQSGRGRVLQMALSKHFNRVALWRVGPEVVTVAGPTEWGRKTFEEILSTARGILLEHCKKFGWDVAELGRPPGSA